MGAALAYYTALSFADVVAEFLALVGKAGGATVETILTHAADQKADRWTALLGFATLLAGASGVFVELQDSLNQIWEMPPRAWSWRILLHERLLSLAMVFVLGFLVLVSLIASAAISAVGGYLKAWLPGFDFLWESVNSVVSLVVITITFAGLFRFLPEVKIAWCDVWTGAGLTSALFVPRETPARILHRPQRLCLGLRGGGMAGDRAALGLPLGADFLPRCGIYARLRPSAMEVTALPSRVTQPNEGR